MGCQCKTDDYKAQTNPPHIDSWIYPPAHEYYCPYCTPKCPCCGRPMEPKSYTITWWYNGIPHSSEFSL